jgi:hypothetical protein
MPLNDMSAATGDMLSLCGHLGDTGNNLGVGQYCQSSGDCTGSTAHFCTAGFSPTSFCTILNCLPDGGSPSCGDNGAMCRCQGATCACVPGRCFNPGLDP